MRRSMKLVYGLGVIAVLIWLPGCPDGGEDVVGPNPERIIGTGTIISDPLPNAPVGVPNARGARVSLALGEAEAESDIVYVSLAAGTYPSGATAVIIAPGASGPITASMVGGGLDPVPVPAAAGDTIELEILNAGGVTLAVERYRVPERRRPRVVRTVPPRGKTDVAVNASVIVVFSEPVSATTVSPATVGVRRGGLPVAGTVRLLPGNGTIAAFTPNVPLDRNTSYQLSVTGEVADLEGDFLEAAVLVAFTTGESSVGAPASIRVSPDTVYLSGDAFQLTATVTDAAGTELIDQVVWESSNPAGLSVSATGLLTPLASGNYTVTARIGDLEGSATVYVRGPPASVTVTPSTIIVPVSEIVVLTATVRDSGGFALNAPISWASSAPAVAAIASIPLGAVVATVTGVTVGSATITATSGGVNEMRSVAVGPRRTVASVSVSPASATLIVGEGRRLSAMPTDANGDVIHNRAITWASDNPGVATVDANGQLTAVAVGTTRATATSDGMTGTATITVTTLNFASLSAGDLHTCGLTLQGAAYCWGELLSFEAGIEARTSRPVAVAGDVEFATVAAGAFHTCGLTSGGAAYCWGYSTLGDGTENLSTTPTRVTGGLTFSALTASYHTCGLTTTGEAYCWGRNLGGQLGDGSTATRLVPTRVVGGLTFAALAAGSYNHTCGLTQGGDAYCWGRNGQGELGNGSTTDSSVPLGVSLSLTFISLAVGGSHTCALSASGEAYCWGAAPVLGNAAGAPSLIPRLVDGGLTFMALSAGISHTCGLVADGSLYCWGRNEDGQLGDGTTSDRLVPKLVVGGIRFSTVSAGGSHTCAQSIHGIAYCWGLNTVGTLGNGTWINSSVPSKVVGQP